MPHAPFDERLDALLRVAAEVFARKGYHATTMRDLSRASGMSLAGMYHYVPGKEDLLYLIERRCFESVLRDVQDGIEKESDPVARLRTFVRRHLAFFAANMNEMKVLSHEAESLTGDRAREILDLKRRYAQLLQRTIAGADGHHPRVAAYALLSKRKTQFPLTAKASRYLNLCGLPAGGDGKPHTTISTKASSAMTRRSFSSSLGFMLDIITTPKPVVKHYNKGLRQEGGRQCAD